MSEPKIRVILRGPYEVTGNIPLIQEEIVENEDKQADHFRTRKEYDRQETYHLCRCGYSSNTPFCDGTHSTLGFIGEDGDDNKPYIEQAIHYAGQAVDLLDQEDRCVLARFCHLKEDIWELIAETDDEEKKELAIYQASLCPGGRLTIISKDGKSLEKPLEQGISAIEDTPRKRRGPLWIKGGITVEGTGGTIFETRQRVALCRCGESRHMPFCDMQHVRCGHMNGIDNP